LKAVGINDHTVKIHRGAEQLGDVEEFALGARN